MFSGIITALEKPLLVQSNNNSMIVKFPVPKGWKVKEGDSILIDGICSTVAKKDNKSFTVFYMPETVKRTSLNFLPDKHEYNMEQSLTLNSIIGGHLVSGHVDIAVQIISVISQDDSYVITIELPDEFNRYVIYKGSIAVNGVSLTVSGITNKTFSVSLIPYTLLHTNLGVLKKGDMVNIEVDTMAKYIEKILLNMKK